MRKERERERKERKKRKKKLGEKSKHFDMNGIMKIKCLKISN